MEQWGIIIWSGLVGAVIGALVGGVATSIGQYCFTRKHTIELERKTTLKLSKALYTELTVLWEKYMDFAGNLVETEKETADSPPLIVLFETPQNYFAVFDSSSHLLGLFDLKDAESIIKTYINAKALFSEIVNYGKLCQRYTEAQLAFPSQRFEELRVTFPQIRNQFEFLRKRHLEVKKLFTSTAEMLKRISSA